MRDGEKDRAGNAPVAKRGRAERAGNAKTLCAAKLLKRNKNNNVAVALETVTQRSRHEHHCCNAPQHIHECKVTRLHHWSLIIDNQAIFSLSNMTDGSHGTP